MEKVKITREQEKQFDDFINVYEDDSKTIDRFIRLKKEEKAGIKYIELKKMELWKFSLLLNGWYEVEQPFEIGNWVYQKSNDNYFKVSEISNDKLRFISLEIANDCFNVIEKVTEPWKIMLLELSREKPEFKVGDIYLTIHGNVNVIKKDTRLEDIEKVVSTGRIKKFYPVEKGIEVKAW